MVIFYKRCIDNIVPTSGMRGNVFCCQRADHHFSPICCILACTAVVTEISYHTKKTIDADVSFLGEAEWRSELKLLVEDLVDEDGNVKSVKSLQNEAGIAWSKVHAVYPMISVRNSYHTCQLSPALELSFLWPYSPNVSARCLLIKLWPPTRVLIAFSAPRSVSPLTPRRSSARKLQNTSTPRTRSAVTRARRMTRCRPRAVTLLWTLLGRRQMPKLWSSILAGQIPTRAAGVHPGVLAVASQMLRSLSFGPLSARSKFVATPLPSALVCVNNHPTSQVFNQYSSLGAVLCDLPGTADANAARNSIAKNYMKNCDCIWILAPITR